MLKSGDILGGMYQIIGQIGQGGGGIIYLANHLRLQKKIVVKKIRDNYAGRIDDRAEVDILKRLHHTHLPQVYDFLVLDSSVYTVMEYVEGCDLQKYMDQGYRFPEATLRKWLLQLSEVLEYLHSQNPPVLHSDIKPANLMVTPQQDIYLIDFNISLDGDQNNTLKGLSSYFAAPEQYQKAQTILYGGKDRIILDGRMDIYSLGATFFFLITGVLPSPEEEVPYDISKVELPYSDGLKAIVSKAMNRRPAARFQTAGHMRQMLLQAERMDPQYRRLVHLQRGGVLLWITCIVVSLWMIYYGGWQQTTERWQTDYSNLYLLAENSEYEKTVSAATGMLQEAEYKRYLKKNEKMHAQVLHILGESYFHKEMYADAADCYMKAWELMPKEGEYCKDYVVALVRDGQLSMVRSVMESAEGMRGLNSGQKSLIQAELVWMDENPEEAVLLAGQIAEEFYALDTETYLEACQLQASIYEEQGNYAQAVLVLEQAQETIPSKEILRQLGHMAAAAASTSTASRNVYFLKAYECYQALEQTGQMSYTDGMNMALVERALGRYEDSNNTLQGLRNMDAEDYRTDMWICYNYLSLMEENPEESQYEREFRMAFSQCKEKYRQALGSDPDMEKLIELAYAVEER